MSSATLPAGVALLATSTLLCPARSGCDGELPLRPSTTRTLTSLTHSLRTEIPVETPLGDPHAPVHPFFRTPHVTSDVTAALRSSWLSRVIEREETFAPSMYLLPVDDTREYEELLLHMDTKTCSGSFLLNRLDAVCNVYEYLEKYFPKPANFQGFGVVPNILLGTNWAESPTTATVPTARGSTQHRAPCDNRLVSKRTLELVRSGVPLRFTEFATTILDCTMSLSEAEFHGPGLAGRILNSAYGEVEVLRSRARMSLYRHNDHREPRGLKDRLSLAIRTLDAEYFSKASTSEFPKILQVLIKDDDMLNLLGLRLETSTLPLLSSTPTPLQSIVPTGAAAAERPTTTEAHRHRLALALFLVLESFPIVAFASRRHVGIAEDYLAHRSKQIQKASAATASIFEEYADAFATAVVKFAPIVFPLEVNHSRANVDVNTSATSAPVSPQRSLGVATTPPPMPAASSRQFQHSAVPISNTPPPPAGGLPLSPPRRGQYVMSGIPPPQAARTSPKDHHASPPAPLERRSTLPMEDMVAAARQQQQSNPSRSSPLRSPRRNDNGPPMMIVPSHVSLATNNNGSGFSHHQASHSAVPVPQRMQPSAGGGGADDLSWWPSNGGGGAAVSRAAPSAATGISSASQQPRSQSQSASPQIPPLVPSHSTTVSNTPPASFTAPLRGVGFGLDDLRKEFETVMRQESPRRSPPRQHQQQPISAPAMSAATALSTRSTHNHAAIPESRPALTAATNATKNHHGQLSQVSPQRHHHVDSGYQSLYQPTVAPAAMAREDPPHHASQYQHNVNINTRTFASSGAGPTTKGEGAALHHHSAGFTSASLQSTTASSSLAASDPSEHRSARNDSGHRSSSPQYTHTFHHKQQQQGDVMRGRLSRSPSGGRSGGGKDIHPWRSPLKQASSSNNRMSLLHASSSSYADPLLMGGGGAGSSRTVRLEPMTLTTRGSAPTTSPYISVEPHATAAAGYSGAHTTTHHHAAASTHHHQSSHYPHDTHRAAPSPAPQVQQRYMTDDIGTTNNYAHRFGYGATTSSSSSGTYHTGAVTIEYHNNKVNTNNNIHAGFASLRGAPPLATSSAGATTGHYHHDHQEQSRRPSSFSVVVKQQPDQQPHHQQNNAPYRQGPTSGIVRRSAELAALEDLLRKERSSHQPPQRY